ncbi:MAG: ATP-grasp domain-containing protein, partial [Terriglobia bacterium]
MAFARSNPQRVMILCTTTGYQTRAFVSAALELGLEVSIGSDRCHTLKDPWRDGALALRFEDPESSARQIAARAREVPVDGIVALGDRPVSTLARACELLGLPGHPPLAADACHDKFISHLRLRHAGVPAPPFARFSGESREMLDAAQARIGFPCVLKPLGLSASQGVMRANSAAEFLQRLERLCAILRAPGVQVMREESSRYVQVERYIEGKEIAVEGLVDRGSVHVLAVFDKSDPLEGPYFEETIYVTPSRLEGAALGKAIRVVRKAVRALGLFHGPFHAELRVNPHGIYMIDLAARSIGGLCSKALRFSSQPLGGDISLEKLLTALALGRNIHPVRRELSA